VLLAPKELEAGNVAVKDLTSGDQREIRRDEAAAWLRTRLDPPAQ
jgi:histidyl-tRNA synthetase